MDINWDKLPQWVNVVREYSNGTVKYQHTDRNDTIVLPPSGVVGPAPFLPEPYKTHNRPADTISIRPQLQPPAPGTQLHKDRNGAWEGSVAYEGDLEDPERFAQHIRSTVIPGLTEWPETIEQLKSLTTSGIVCDAHIRTRGGETTVVSINGVARERFAPDREFERFGAAYIATQSAFELYMMLRDDERSNNTDG